MKKIITQDKNKLVIRYEAKEPIRVVIIDNDNNVIDGPFIIDKEDFELFKVPENCTLRIE